jgi:conjugative relaxase-like TrwC/TraI family protein
MLTVAKVTQGSAAGYADYLEGKAQAVELGDYYLKDGERVEAPGRWASGAGIVGQDPGAVVSGEVLRELMAVRRPDTGRPLRRVGGTGEAVAALDATFSAPKSVSAVWALSGPELRMRVERAHETAVDRALSYSVARVAMIRQRIDQRTVIHAKPAGLVATSWRHTTARSVEGRAPDPQLHSHVLLHGAVRPDGRIVAIDSRAWLVHRREVGAAYRTELAHELSQLGFGIERGTGRGGRYFEIAGIPTGLTDRWSARHHEVHAAIQDWLDRHHRRLAAVVAAGGPDAADATKRLELMIQSGLAPREERHMATATRSAKTPVTHHDLDAHWQQTGREHGLDHRKLEQLRVAHRPLAPAGRRALIDGLTEFDATFAARDARAVALEVSAGVPIAVALHALGDLRDTGELLRLADGTATTREHRNRERAALRVAERLAASTAAPLDPGTVDAQAQQLDAELGRHGGRLSGEQRRALELACGQRRLVVIEGQAGTGKSTTLTAIARAHQHAGRSLIVTSTAALAAQRLARELDQAGVNTTAYSTAALQAAIRAGQVESDADTTVIHDEAALASTREQHQLLQAIEQSGARLIEVGDPRQNHAVGAGGLWPHLEAAARHAGSHAELTHNQRATDPADRRDQRLFRSGEHERALRGYASRDRVHHHDDQRWAEDAALESAHRDRREGKLTIVIAQTTNEHLDELNARAQAIRHQHGELGPESLPATGRPYQLHAGDHVQVRRNLTHPQHGQLRNGTTAHVTKIDAAAATITLTLADKRYVTLDRAQAERADLRLAYVQHPFPAQGQTTDTAHLIVSEHATREGSYVALTRARQQTRLYTGEALTDEPPQRDRLQTLAVRLSRTEPDLPSIRTPLAHEHTITAQPDPPQAVRMTDDHDPDIPGPAPTASPTGDQRASELDLPPRKIRGARDEPPRQRETMIEIAGDATVLEQGGRRWPDTARRDNNGLDRVRIDLDELQRDRHPGWEP